MGRRHLSLALLVSLAVAASAAAASSIPWRLAAQGVAIGVSPEAAPSAVVVTTASGAARITAHIPPAARRMVRRLNYRTSLLVGVFAPFGCKDARVRVSRVVESGRTLIVKLLVKPPAPGVMECMAVYTTYRLVVVSRRGLTRAATAARVTVAGA